jgi:FlaA1/EpsC-like NDP-sugar epimerase
MTIPEAVSLVLQAGGLGNGGEIFALKMGTPVRIADMARDLISLSGFVPDKEIKITFSGLRPGEKLYEELITDGENVAATRLKDIMVMKNADILSLKDMNRHIRDLVDLAKAGDAAGIKEKLHIVVPEYSPQPENRAQAEKPPKPAAMPLGKIHEGMTVCAEAAVQNS